MVNAYRTDIDGLRALAVISVILFHLGYLQNGYLGVDIFFVISGYLITGILYRESTENRFSILKFYERRIRRIIPLVLCIGLVTLLLGLYFMLPNDLENLCQAIFASNFSANNILMYITSGDYWGVKNDYKPLMHTWSLGIEEQFYLLYPLIFFFLKKRKYILFTLVFLTLFSCIIFILQENNLAKFYFIQYRFFELSIGGVAAIYFNSSNLNYRSSKNSYLLFVLVLLLLVLLLLPITINYNSKILFTVVITSGILILGDVYFQKNKLYKTIFSNKIISGIGKISFSLYMWHHIVFSFARYAFVKEISVVVSVFLISITILLSIVSYVFIENTFRDSNRWSTKKVLISLSLAFVLITGASFYVYSVGGVVKDVPELGLKYEVFPKKMNFFNSSDNIQIQYNEQVRILDKPFSDSKKVKVLVVGSSLGRDFVNVLKESNFINSLEVRYFDINRIESDNSFKNRVNKAKHIFFTDKKVTKEYIQNLELKYEIGFSEKMIVVGPKDFGYSNGLSYNKVNSKSFNSKTYRTQMKKGVLATNIELKSFWGSQYIDLIELVSDSEGNVLVFTPDGKFISQDTVHFTKFGATYFASLLQQKLQQVIELN